MNDFDTIAASEKRRLRITAIKVMQLKRNNGQSLVKIETDGGVYGIGEAGAVAATVRAFLRYYEPMLLGEDPLEIEKLKKRAVEIAAACLRAFYQERDDLIPLASETRGARILLE